MGTANAHREKKDRLDKMLLERGLVESRHKAQALIMEGKVWVEGKRVEKAGVQVRQEAVIEVRGETCPYVSRGGTKLEKALDHWQLPVRGKIFLDAGASTGGFTDCLLQRGADRVFAVDVGYGQLAWKLQCDERVVNIERTNIRYLEKTQLTGEPDSAVIDVSFISLRKVIPKVLELIKKGGDILALIKPQFEVAKGDVGKRGVIRDALTHESVIEEISSFALETGLTVRGVVESPLMGPKGNREFFIYLKEEGST
jgi:23S rRNA (cytidine1920-2'-O)/16S rRNA (cytidine1409-2'-O)-methyltransferase